MGAKPDERGAQASHPPQYQGDHQQHWRSEASSRQGRMDLARQY